MVYLGHRALIQAISGDALSGAGTCHDVRAKFVEATREAGVLLGDG
jgi:hypothetical protein